MMHLAIDIGNTALKFVIFDGETIMERGSGITELALSLDTNRAMLSRAIMTSVADSVAAIDLLRKFNIPLTILSHQTVLPILNSYQSAETLGPDRIALAVAADRAFGGLPSLVIGAGTCITYNFIDRGNFLGGAISPGITMRFQALNHYTARLPYIDWAVYQDRAFEDLIGADSKGSILSGVLNGVVQEIDGTIEQYRHRYSGLRVAVTG